MELWWQIGKRMSHYNVGWLLKYFVLCLFVALECDDWLRVFISWLLENVPREKFASLSETSPQITDRVFHWFTLLCGGVDWLGDKYVTNFSSLPAVPRRQRVKGETTPIGRAGCNDASDSPKGLPLVSFYFEHKYRQLHLSSETEEGCQREDAVWKLSDSGEKMCC